MNWMETIKINEDLGTPLNEKSEMIGGVWPRNIILVQKQFSRSHNGADENFNPDELAAPVYELEGRGFVTGINLDAPTGTYYANAGGGDWYNAPANPARVTIVIDDSKTFYVQASGSSASATVDLANLRPSASVLASCDLTGKVLNDVISFETSCRVYLSFAGLSTQYDGIQVRRSISATLEYGLY